MEERRENGSVFFLLFSKNSKTWSDAPPILGYYVTGQGQFHTRPILIVANDTFLVSQLQFCNSSTIIYSTDILYYVRNGWIDWQKEKRSLFSSSTKQGSPIPDNTKQSRVKALKNGHSYDPLNYLNLYSSISSVLLQFLQSGWIEWEEGKCSAFPSSGYGF
ncbi:hypothetical protein SLE2022_346770 [Rubroshorea leprosula]